MYARAHPGSGVEGRARGVGEEGTLVEGALNGEGLKVGEGEGGRTGQAGSAAALLERNVVALGCATACSRDGAGGARGGEEGQALGGALEVYTLKTHPGASLYGNATVMC